MGRRRTYIPKNKMFTKEFLVYINSAPSFANASDDTVAKNENAFSLFARPHTNLSQSPDI